jgi:hypothetical protein
MDFVVGNQAGGTNTLPSTGKRAARFMKKIPGTMDDFIYLKKHQVN